MFTERKITAFQNRISDLPDTPTLTAAELKARFDACPEELREALNGVCEDGKVLEGRMDEYRAQTFTGEITREMLSSAVQTELDGKASQATLDTEATVRQSADSALSSRVSSLENQVPQRAQIYFLSYTGTQGDRTFTLSFVPKMVIVSCHDYADTVPTAPLAVAQGQTVYYSKNEVASLSGTILRLTAYGGHNTLNKSYAILALA